VTDELHSRIISVKLREAIKQSVNPMPDFSSRRQPFGVRRPLLPTRSSNTSAALWIGIPSEAK